MKKKRMSLMKRTFGVMVLLTLLLAVWLMLQFVLLPRDAAENAFSTGQSAEMQDLLRQEMSVQYLHPVLIPTVIYLVLMAVCAVYFLWQKRRQQLREQRMPVTKAKQDVFPTEKEETEPARTGKEKRRRWVAAGICGVFCIGCAVACVMQIVRMLRDPSWSVELFSGLLLTALPWVTAVLAILLAFFAFAHLSRLREQAEEDSGEQETNHPS